MSVELLNTSAQIEAIRDNWESIYSKDENASIFMSWTWLTQLRERRQDAVCVLAYRPSASSTHHVAYLPLRKRIGYNGKARKFYNLLCMAGNDWADHTGVLCLPGYEDTALPQLGHYIAGMQPARIHLHNLSMRKSNSSQLKNCFENSRYRIKREYFKDNDGMTSLNTSPQVELDETFELWLNNKASANTRQKIRRLSRQLNENKAALIRQTDQETMRIDLDNLQKMWTERWATIKGSRAKIMGEKYRRIVEDGMNSGQIFVLVLQNNDSPVAIHAYYTDPVRKSILFYVGARDLSQKIGSPGLLLHAKAIENAIAKGFSRCDFLRGDEKYKYSLGAKDTTLRSYTITDRELPGAARLLDEQCLPQVLDLLSHHSSHRSEDTMQRLYAQALDSWPTDKTLIAHYTRWQNR